MTQGILRSEFPLLSNCTYLNSNAAGAAPRGIDAVLCGYRDSLFRYRDEIWAGWWESLRRYEGKLAALVGGEPGSIALDGNLSALLGRLLSCIDFRGARRRIVTTDLEFPTVRFLARAFERHGAELVVVKSRDGATIDEEAVARAIDERTALVVVSLATYGSGALTDVAAIARAAREFGAICAVDAYAAVGAAPVDVKASGVDVLLGGAHKWLCGSYECAFMYVSPRVVASLEPAATGWMASRDPLSFGEPAGYAEDARRFSAGTPAVLPALVSEVGLDLVQSVGIDNIRELSLARTRRILERARDAHIESTTPADDARRGGIVALRFPGSERIARLLVERDMVCSHRGALRIAPHFYNDDDEIERFMDALVELATELRR